MTALFEVKVIVLFLKISEGFISGPLIWKGCLVLSMTGARGTRVTVRVSTTPRGCGLGLEQNLGLPILNFVDVDCNCPEPDPYLFYNSAGSNSSLLKTRGIGPATAFVLSVSKRCLS